MTDRVFIDTNFFVYTIDSRDRAKQEVARKLIREVNNAVVSSQVMQEFYDATTKKLKVPPLDARRMMQVFDKFEVIPTTPKLVMEAINLHILDQIQFWDALIVTAARYANCSVILTEDLNDGQAIDGVQILNPFTLH